MPDMQFTIEGIWWFILLVITPSVRAYSDKSQANVVSSLLWGWFDRNINIYDLFALNHSKWPITYLKHLNNR